MTQNAACERMKVGYLIPDTKCNSNWMKGLNIRPKIIKYREENTGKTLHDTYLRNIPKINRHMEKYSTSIMNKEI